MAKIAIDIKSGSFEQSDPIIGIDLGTTNSLVAYVPKGDTQPVCLTNNQNRYVLVPSILHFSADGSVITGTDARKHLIDDPEHTIYSVKRLMGKSYRDIADTGRKPAYRILDDDEDKLVKIVIDGKYFTPIELSAEILKELKQTAEINLGVQVRKAVITVPAYFNDAQRQATRDAGKLAGLDVLRILNEPTAAALAYGIGLDPQQKKTIAVYDFGGGTFDMSILHIHDGLFEVLATHGDTWLGGDDIDMAVVQRWIEVYGLPEELSVAEKQQLRLWAEEAKKQIGHDNHFSQEINSQGKKLLINLTQNELYECMDKVLRKTFESCRQAIADSGLQMNQLDEVLLVGGSTRSVVVKQKVQEFFKDIPVNDTLNPDEVVALGAAVEADILAGNRTDVLLLDVTPLSLGIETLGGLMDVLITRNSKIPVKASRQYTTSVDGQVNLKIAVYQGEREMVSQNRKLGEFILHGIPAMPAGLPKIEIVFLLNADGILQVKATELRSGVEQAITIKPQYGLTDEEVEKMLLDSLLNAKTDMEMRSLIEAKSEATQLMYTTGRFIEKNAAMLSTVELNGTQHHLDELKKAIESDDRNLILAKHEALNEFTRPFAERLMDTAIGKALKGKAIE